MSISLHELIRIAKPQEYKLHLACENEEGVRPLDEFVTDRANWDGWNEWRGRKNDWTRRYIFSLIQFYPKADRWLFGGLYEVLETRPDGYRLQLLPDYQEYVGRLLAAYHRTQGMRGRGYLLENHFDQFTVAELFPTAYSGEAFPGYAEIEHDFHVLEPIFKNERTDWKAALQSLKGVYLIADRLTGKKYVGSAYSGSGIWSRWACYIGTGHGYNDELTALIKANGIDYARQNFIFSILEIFATSMPDDHIQHREGHWKRVLQSRLPHGYNRN